MCLLVFADGTADGANICVSLYLKLMKGEYDDQLKWPLRGKFTIQLLSQNGSGDERLWIRTVVYDSGTADKRCSRVIDEEISKVSLGIVKFIRHSELKPVYLRNDCLKFRIKYQS
jgi:hypothetical protein